jgi:uncharacterized protein (TIGR03086 family)
MVGVESVELFEAAAQEFRAVMGMVDPEQHHLPTPCAPLDVRQLISRAIGHQNWVRSAIHGHASPPDYPPIDPDVWLDAFDESTAAMLDELRSDDAMTRSVTLAAGLTFSGEEVALLAARNIFQFAWDLATATGQNADLAPEVATELLKISRTRLVPQRRPGGFFGPEFVPATGSPTATVLAGFLGREV